MVAARAKTILQMVLRMCLAMRTYGAMKLQVGV
jgi:hypothetical protein